MSGLRIAGPLLALNLGHSAFEVGLLFSMFGLTAVFFSLHAGRTADRLGLRPIVGMSVLVAITSTGLAALWPNYWTLCLASLGSGGAVSYAMVALQRHAAKSTRDPTELKKVFSWLGIGPAISNFIGPVIAGLLIDRAGFGWALGVLALMPTLTWVFVRGLPASVQAAQTPGSAESGRRDLLASPQFRRLLLLNWVQSCAWDVHSFMVPVMGHALGFSASTIGVIVGSFAAAATVVRMLLPSIAARLVEWQVIRAVTLTAAALLTLYPFLTLPWLMGLGSALLGAVLGAVQPMMLSTLHQITPPHRLGEALGIRMLVTNLASVIMPLGFGAAGAAVGVKSVFWAVALANAAGSQLAKTLRLDDAKMIATK